MVIKFKLNKRKMVESVLWLIKHGVSNKYYGRPVTGESYLAMEHGTVPRWLFKVACKTKNIGFEKSGRFDLIAERDYKRELFSETDIEALEFGCNEYKDLKNFDEVKEKNHKEPAWKKAWKKRGIMKEYPISFENLIDEAWLKKELKWKSHFMVI